jgi:hypothetical protein
VLINFGRLKCLVLAFAFIASASARAVLIPHVIFTEDRSFKLLAPEEAVKLSGKIPLPVWLNRSASDGCALSPEKAASEMEGIFSPGQTLEASLSNLFEDPFSHFPKNVMIVIDHFRRPDIFNSFFVRAVPLSNGRVTNIIGLDCSIFAQGYWAASLAHELTHAMLAERSSVEVESWLEEGLAQLTESSAGGVQPVVAAVKFARLDGPLPSLIETARPLKSSENYAMAFLFAEYIQGDWGGWKTLRAMAGLSESFPRHLFQSCDHEAAENFLNGAVCRARVSLEERRGQNRDGMLRADAVDPELLDRTTRAGLLRFFAAAMALHLNDQSYYSIPGWNGWRSPYERGLRQSSGFLAPGEFQLLAIPSNSNAVLNITPSSGLEAYSIQESRGLFKITAQNPTDLRFEGLARVTSSQEAHEFILVVNTGMQTSKYIWKGL